MAKLRPEFDRYPDHLPAKVIRTPHGVQYELPFRRDRGTVGLIVITTFDYVDDPTVAIWEIARES